MSLYYAKLSSRHLTLRGIMGGEMARRGQRLVPLELSDTERETLGRFVRPRKTADSL